MKYGDFIRLVKMDMARYANNKKIFKLFLTSGSFRLVFRYRLVNYFKQHKILKIFYPIERLLYHKCCVKNGCDIPSHVQIGGGWKIIHTWGIVMNSHTIAGENFTVLSGSVIGLNHTGTPTFGNNVYIGSHALVIGGVHIGNNVEVGAGAIVTHNVPDNAVVICDSAHVHKIKEVKM